LGASAVAVAAATLTVTEALGPVPPALLQLNENAVGAVSLAVTNVPAAACVPAQPPEAVQAVGVLLETQVNLDVPPLTTVDGMAVMVTTGTGVGSVPPPPAMAIATGVAVTLPPAPLHVRVKVVAALNGAEACEPLAATAALLTPSLSEHEVALVETHVNVVARPAATVVGAALRVADGNDGGGAATTATSADAVALAPPAPLQTSENTVSAAKAVVVSVPLAAWVPLQPPEAMHAVALVEFHVRVVVPPGATLAGYAASVAVGTTLMVTEADGLLPSAPTHVNV
jgi:hypothetical protein